MSNVFGVNGASGAGFGIFGPEPAPDPSQPAWMTSFQDTLKEIQEKGFQAYAKEVNDQKIAEMRKKILEQMGLSEEDLAKMSAEQRAGIEKAIAEEIRKRLAAQSEMAAKGESKGKDGAAPAGVDAVFQGVTTADTAAQTATEAKASNGFGPGMTLIRAMEAAEQAQVAETRKDP